MNCIEMSYKGFTFAANPNQIKIRLSKKLAAQTMPFQKSRVQEICDEPSVISGTGSLEGKNAEQEAYRLMLLFKLKGSAYLFSPVLPPLKMFLKELTVSSNAEKERIDYSFSFVEDASSKKHARENRFTYVQSGENLFDVANRINYPVEYLAQVNGVKDLFSVKERDKIWLK